MRETRNFLAYDFLPSVDDFDVLRNMVLPSKRNGMDKKMILLRSQAFSLDDVVKNWLLVAIASCCVVICRRISD